MLIRETKAASNGIQGVNSSAWFPIRKEPCGNGGFDGSDCRHISGGESVVVRSGVSLPHNDQDLRARRSIPYPANPCYGEEGLDNASRIC
jgi:hypothetical protein